MRKVKVAPLVEKCGENNADKRNDRVSGHSGMYGGIMNGTLGLDTGGPDEDGLSYSSTEHEASVHEGYISQHLNNSGLLNLSLASQDSAGVMRLQEQLRETRRLHDKERSIRTSTEHKRKTLAKERTELLQKLEEVTRAKSTLEQNKIDQEAKLRSLHYNLNEEEEKRRNAEMLLTKTKEQLSRKDEQYTEEVEAKQKSELALRNIQMELRTTLTNIKQLEDEKEDIARQLAHEKNARQLQEQINNDQHKMHQSIQDGSLGAEQASKDELSEVISRLEEADENRKQAHDTLEKINAELYSTKMESERQRTRFKDEHSLLSSENEDLQTRIEELKSDIKLNEEALAHATMTYNIQLSQLKTDNALLNSHVEKERASREKLESELESVHSRMQSSGVELEKTQTARSDLERQNHKDQEEWKKLLERRDMEMTQLKEANSALMERISAAESKVSVTENELHISNATLNERTNQLTTLQKELEQRRASQDSLDGSYRKEKEESVRAQTKLESLQERLSNLQHENLSLRKQADDMRLANLHSDKDNSSEKFTLMLNSMREDHDRARSGLEEKNSALSETISHLREELRSVESRRSALEQEVRQLHQENTDGLRKMSVAEASLEVTSRAKDQLESERASLRQQIESLQTKLDNAKELQIEAQTRAKELAVRLERAEYNSTVTEKKFYEQSDVTQQAQQFKSDLEDEVHRLELENAKMEAALKHEAQKVQMLQRDLDDSNRVRSEMEKCLANMKTMNAALQENLREADAAKTYAANNAEDSRDLWESEVKARSKLGLRIAQLERGKQEIQTACDEEKRKTRKAMELKKLAETKLEAEINKNAQLSKDVATLRAHLKNAKKRLKELDTSDNRLNVLNSNFEKERGEMDKMMGSLRKQNHVNNNYVPRLEVDRIREELEAENRLVLNAKLEELNKHLSEQAAAREHLDRLRDTNETEMRREFEKTKKELVDELNKLRSNYSETVSNKEVNEMEAHKYREMYEQELKLRERLADKLERASARANKTQAFMNTQAIPNNALVESAWFNTTMPLLDKTPNKHGINDLSARIRAELDRSINKHMEKRPQVDISPPPRTTMDDSILGSSFNKSSSQYMEVLKKNYYL